MPAGISSGAIQDSNNVEAVLTAKEYNHSAIQVFIDPTKLERYPSD